MSSLSAGRRSRFIRVIVLLALVAALGVLALPAGATPPEEVCFDVVAGLGGTPGTWSATGLVESSGTAEFDPFVAGWDDELGQPATVHDRFVATDDHGSITFQAQGHSALVVNEQGDTVPGWLATWTIIDGTGAYADLHGQGDGYAYIDWESFEFLAFQCGQAHYD